MERRAEIHWYEATGIGRKEFKIKRLLENEMTPNFVICIDNDEYPASLERRKLYEIVPDTDAESLGQLRVKDESGEDYLYPKELFVSVELPSSTEKAVISAA